MYSIMHVHYPIILNMLYVFSKSFTVCLYVNFPNVSTLKILSVFYYYRVSSLGALKMLYLKN